jgi:hypothetical protein
VLRTRCSGVQDAAHFVIMPVLTAAIFLPLQRQRLMVQQFYTEVGALEEVLEEAAYALGDEAYSVLTQVSKYIDQVGSERSEQKRHWLGLAAALAHADAAPYVCAKTRMLRRNGTRPFRIIKLPHAMPTSGAHQLCAAAPRTQVPQRPGGDMHQVCHALLRLGCAALCSAGDQGTQQPAAAARGRSRAEYHPLRVPPLQVRNIPILF